MSRLCVATITLLLVSVLTAAEDETAVEQLIRMEHEFAAAALRRDFSGLEELLDPEFVGVDPRGTELTRAQVLENLRSPDRQITSLSHENVRVRMFADTAVVLAVTVMRAKHNGEVVEGRFPYMRVWVKRDGEWRAIATQSSAMAPK